MSEPTIEQIRNFRLRSHHLDADYSRGDIIELAGTCGMQNSPPGAWETALFNRAPDCGLAEMERLLYEEKTLLQAWSFRGAPFVFPTSESDVFLSALRAEDGEPWIYTQGIGLALDFLQMTYEELYRLMMQVMPRLDGHMISGKNALDQTVAGWMCPHLPAEKQELWNSPSMYGAPDKQTVGGAVVSFLLRPAAFNGLVVFGGRDGSVPSFTSLRSWLGRGTADAGKVREAAAGKLVRKFLHCYGPASADSFISWLGCSKTQGKRLWQTVSEEIEPVTVSGKTKYILSRDRERLFYPVSFQKDLLLLGGHDPYLDQRDRAVLQANPFLQKQIWRLVSNPGAIVYQGEVIGIWTGKKKGNGMDISMTLWADLPAERKEALPDLAERYTVFRGLKLLSVSL